LYEFLHENLNRSFYSYLQVALEAHEVSGGVVANCDEGEGLILVKVMIEVTHKIYLLHLSFSCSVLVSLYLIR
jgi:hypothetical protein